MHCTEIYTGSLWPSQSAAGLWLNVGVSGPKAAAPGKLTPWESGKPGVLHPEHLESLDSPPLHPTPGGKEQHCRCLYWGVTWAGYPLGGGSHHGAPERAANHRLIQKEPSISSCVKLVASLRMTLCSRSACKGLSEVCLCFRAPTHHRTRVQSLSQGITNSHRQPRHILRFPKAERGGTEAGVSINSSKIPRFENTQIFKLVVPLNPLGCVLGNPPPSTRIPPTLWLLEFLVQNGVPLAQNLCTLLQILSITSAPLLICNAR